MLQSIEPNIADLVNWWLKSYNVDYKLEQENLDNSQINNALNNYHSKSGWKWWNRPDAKLLKTDKNQKNYPVLIEYKGYKDKLEKLDSDWKVENINAKGEVNFKNIKEYAVNWAIHYSNAILHYTTFEEIIAIWVTGYKDKVWNIHHQIWVYFVSKENLGIGQKVWDFSDLSFLKNENFDNFIEKVKTLHLSEEELEKAKEQREKEIDKSLKALNNDIYQNEEWLGENDRVYLVAASIIATIWIAWKVPVLEKDDLKSQDFEWWRDWDIILNRIKAFLWEKKIPEDKKNLIIRTLSNTLLTENINKVKNWETQLKRVFTKIVDDLWIYYKIGLTTDFTWKLFNEMYSWLGFTQDKLNDVVLTPASVSNLLVKLARVNKDSYVWDFATGSAWLLVAAMNEMLKDAKENIKSPEELALKQAQIKAEQLLGLELLSSVYMLAILNMIMMWDGSSNILNKNSLTDFNWKYWFWKTNELFPADAFILNPPYSDKEWKTWKGMIFVEKALSMMNKWYAAIIIQNSAGSWKAKEFNKRILEKNTLIASIKMPNDIFIWKASVQTNIYVFKVWEKHDAEQPVKFIDFSNDWYTRADRKKWSNNLKDTDNAKWRYDELVKLVKFWKSKLKIFTEKEYHESTIDPKNGADWNQTAPIDTKPTLDDFKKTVWDYLAWQTNNILKKQYSEEKIDIYYQKELEEIKWWKFKLWDLFNIENTLSFNKDELMPWDEYDYVTRTSQNQWILQETWFVNEENINSAWNWSLWLLQMDFFYRYKPWYAGQFVRKITPKIQISEKSKLFFTVLLNQQKPILLSVLVRDVDKTFKNLEVSLPIKEWEIDFNFMEKFIEEIEKEKLDKLKTYFKV